MLRRSLSLSSLLPQCRQRQNRVRIQSRFRLVDLNFDNVQNDSCQRRFSVDHRRTGAHKIKASLRECYVLLEITEDAELTEVREAYIKSAKLYHPDSGSEKADPLQFSRIKEAYKSILEQRKEEEASDQVTGRSEDITEKDMDEMIFDIRHTAPQHRQYLSFDGIGSGTPAKRQRIYQQYRVAKASDNIHDYRTQHLANVEESAVIVKDKQHAKKAKISNAIERLVEDMIVESMNKGDFDNLVGKGQPLSYENRNPLLDTDTHNLNKILINNGYAPEWIMLQGEIRKSLKDGRRKLAVFRSKMGDPPFDPEDLKKWKSQVSKYQAMILDVNLKINKFNMIVPFLEKQLVHYNAGKDVDKIMKNWHQFLPDSQEDTDVFYNSHFGSSQAQYQISQHKVDWTEVWLHIKQVFRSR